MSGQLRALLVEDCKDDAELLVKELERAGYECVSERVHDENGLRAALKQPWDVIICDYRLPQFDGAEALKIIRPITETPVLIVSGAIGEETAVEALKAGADDYLLKDRIARLGPAVKRALREANLRRVKKSTESALRESEERYRQLVESSPDGMLIFENGKLVYANPSSVDLFGARTPMDLLGRGAADLFKRPDDELVLKRLEEAMEGRTPMPAEVHLNGLSGPARVVELALKSVVHHGEKAVQATCRDISLRRQLEQELRQNQRMEAVARLAAGVAHDFNNLLTVLIGHIGLIKSGLPHTDPIYQDVQQAAAVADRAFHLTHQLLALSRKQTLSLLPLSLNTVILQTQSLILRGLRDEIHLQVSLAPDLRPARMDAGQMEHVLLNLAAHAKSTMQHGGKLALQTFNVQFTPESADKPHEMPDGDYVCLKVSDTGVGLPEDAQEQIFEPFITSSGAMGPGLALSTVYGIVRQHNGHIYCRSELGKGSTFTIYLPAHASTVGKEVDPQAPPVAARAGRAKTILVVEDEEMLRDFAQLVLRRNGFTVLSAANGREALQICQRENQEIDLVFTDVVMPAMSGPELVRELPKYRPNVPVLFTSGYTEPVLVDHGLHLTSQEFLSKPYTVQSLVAKISEALHRKAEKDAI
ncbi:MAG TPA: response regulator [Methylomirabilota bacterium]|nr:response regulator [Methylomirabilota bacterium]